MVVAPDFLGILTVDPIVCNPQDCILSFKYRGPYEESDTFFAYPWGITEYDGKLYVVDKDNMRVMVLSSTDLSYLTKIIRFDSYDHFYSSSYICCDENNIFITEGDYWFETANNHRIIKLNRSDYSYVAKIGSLGSGDDQFDWPSGICCDETYIYVCDSANNRIQKRLKSNLSLVAQIGTYGSGDDQFYYPEGICQYGDYIIVVDQGNNRLVKRRKSDLSYVSEGFIGWNAYGVCVDTTGTYVYVCENFDSKLVKYKFSDLTYVAEIDGVGAIGCCCDENYLYLTVPYGDGTNIIKKYDLSTIGTTVHVDDEIFTSGDLNEYVSLLNQKIVPDSEVVTDLGETLVYEKGLDYNINYDAGSIAIITSPISSTEDCGDGGESAFYNLTDYTKAYEFGITFDNSKFTLTGYKIRVFYEVPDLEIYYESHVEDADTLEQLSPGYATSECCNCNNYRDDLKESGLNIDCSSRRVRIYIRIYFVVCGGSPAITACFVPSWNAWVPLTGLNCYLEEKNGSWVSDPTKFFRQDIGYYGFNPGTLSGTFYGSRMLPYTQYKISYDYIPEPVAEGYNQVTYQQIGCTVSSPEYNHDFMLPPVDEMTEFKHKIQFEGEPSPEIYLQFYSNYPPGVFVELTDVSINCPCVCGRSFGIILG